MKVEIGDRVFYRGFNRGGAQDDRGVEKFESAEREKSGRRSRKSGVTIAKVWGDDSVNEAP